MILDLRHCTDGELPGIRHVLLDVYAEVYAGQLHVPFTSLERFDQRLTNHSRGTGWEAVIGYAGTEAVGYAYAAPLPEDRAGLVRGDRRVQGQRAALHQPARPA
ncbi:hypothetical protein ABZ428_33005, partial [Micromonospora matsumotoense]